MYKIQTADSLSYCLMSMAKYGYSIYLPFFTFLIINLNSFCIDIK